MRILSLDLGIKSLGVSISDKTNTIAIPLENLFFHRGIIDSPLNKIKELIDEKNITLVLIGMPLKTTGEKAEISTFIKDFAIKLKEVSGVEIKYYDERYSTKRGQELFLNNKKSNKRNTFKQQKDLLASYVILHDYLNHNSHKLEKEKND